MAARHDAKSFKFVMEGSFQDVYGTEQGEYKPIHDGSCTAKSLTRSKNATNLSKKDYADIGPLIVKGANPNLFSGDCA